MPDENIKKLQAELATLAKFPEYNPGPVCRIDRSGVILQANQAARKRFGNNVKGRQWRDVCTDFTEQDWAEVLECTGTKNFESKTEGAILQFTFVCPGDSAFVFVYGADVTELRHMQTQLSEQAAQLKEVARFPEMNPGPVLRMDLDGNVLLANAAAREIFGDEILEQCWRNIFPGMDKSTWARILNSMEPVSLEARFGSNDYVFAHRRDHQTKLVFVFGSDISLLKKTERALLQSEKMATLGTLAAGVAHELNNPAAATKRAAQQLRDAFNRLERIHVLLNAQSLTPEQKQSLEIIEQLALDKSKEVSDLDALTRSDREEEIEDWLDDQDIPDPYDLAPYLVSLDLQTDQLENYQGVFEDLFPNIISWTSEIFTVYTLLNEINQGSARISEIVGALKNYSYLGQAPIQSVNLHDGIENTLIILRNKLKKGITVKREYSEDIPPIMAYGSELNQVWTNLLDNAADAMNEKGEIRIRTKRDGSWAIIEIEDNGPGIPEEYQSRIFDAFFTTKDLGKGTGLGLSNSYGIICDKHKGNISVDSKPGMTRFTVKLPIGTPVSSN